MDRPIQTSLVTTHKGRVTEEAHHATVERTETANNAVPPLSSARLMHYQGQWSAMNCS